MLWTGQNVLGLPRLHDPSGVHHGQPIGEPGNDAKVVRDHQDGHIQVGTEAAEEIENLGTDRDVERGRRLVRDQERWLAGQGHRDHRPLPHAAAELVWVVVHAAPWGRDSDHVEQLDGPFARRRVIQSAVSLEALSDLSADGQDRVQARQRILEDHGDTRPPDVAQLILWQSNELAAFEAHAAGGDASDPLRKQAQQCEGAHALPGTRLPNQAQGLARCDCVRQAANGVDHPPPRELHPKIVDSQQRTPGPGAPDRGRYHRRLGHRALYQRISPPHGAWSLANSVRPCPAPVAACCVSDILDSLAGRARPVAH